MAVTGSKLIRAITAIYFNYLKFINFCDNDNPCEIKTEFTIDKIPSFCRLTSQMPFCPENNYMKTKNVSRDTIQKIQVDQISPNPKQARIDFDKAGLVELAESIKATGLLQPIIVRPVGNRSNHCRGKTMESPSTIRAFRD